MIPYVALFSALFLFVHSYGAATGGLNSSRQNPQTPQAPQATDVLALGAPIERELAGPEAHAYRITLASRQFLHVLINQQGIDVVLRCFGPDARQIAEVNNTTGPQGSERLYLIAEAAGDYLLEVRPARREAARGRYDVRVEELREATPRDLSLVAAGRASAEGRRLRRQFTEESLRIAVTKYEEALRLYRAAEDREREVDSLNNIGDTLRMLGDNLRASNLYLEALSLSRSFENRPHRHTHATAPSAPVEGVWSGGARSQ
jgi:tetratricopeptide (TPR) repeat protein